MNVEVSPSRERMAEILLDSGALAIDNEKGFRLASGRLSPVYVDCRLLLAQAEARHEALRIAAKELAKLEFEALLGGETAGIPFASCLAELLSCPMGYVRKKPKTYGRTSAIEGFCQPEAQIVLIEDLATDSGSKLGFIETIQHSGMRCRHCLVFFHYGIFPQSRQRLAEHGVELIDLADWHDVVAVLEKRQALSDKDMSSLRAFLASPDSWTLPRRS